MNESKKYLINLQKFDSLNKKCVDCGSLATFVDIKYGSFICVRCAGLHRELGTDYCVVKSISLDILTQIQLKIFAKTKGNTHVNLEYEALDKKEIERLKPNQSSSDVTTREFIRRKYKTRQFYKQYVEPIPVVKENSIHEIQQIEDMIVFDEHVICPTIEPFVFHSLEQTQQCQQPILTQEQIKEMEKQKKINDIMKMFN